MDFALPETEANQATELACGRSLAQKELPPEKNQDAPERGISAGQLRNSIACPATWETIAPP